MLDGFRSKGHLSRGVELTTGGRLKVIFQDKSQNGHANVGSNTVDSRIVALALHVQQADPKTRTILVTKDINLRIKADALGLAAEDYETDRVMIKDLYTGIFEMNVTAEKMAAFRNKANSSWTRTSAISRMSTARCWMRPTPKGPP